MTELLYTALFDENQFQSALRVMVVVSLVLFEAGYFLGLPKCFLIPEIIITYLGIQCDSLRTGFSVPEEGIQKYLPCFKTS